MATFTDTANIIDIQKNAWVTVNNDFWVSSEAIGQLFSWVMKSWVKIIGKEHHEWPKDGYSCIILFFTCYHMSWKHNSAKHNYQLLISPLLLRTVFSDRTLWHHHTWSVTSRQCGVLTLRHHFFIVLACTNWCKGDLHYWITTVNIDFSPPGIHGLACKKC